jgi:2-hydroxymuconate-semialdehyde hydrolase
MIVICGGGEILRNRYSSALFEYDATFEAMRKIVEALFHDPSYPANDAYVQRRYESSIAPGAWEAIAAARFRRPVRPLPTSWAAERGPCSTDELTFRRSWSRGATTSSSP